MTKVRLDALGTSTTLESNKSVISITDGSYCALYLSALCERILAL